jgi:signal transduction histidine kinase
MGVDWFRRIARRYRRADPFKADLVLALVFVAAVVLEACLNKTGGQSRVATALAGSAAMLTIAWRRRSPFAAALAFAVIAACQSPVDSFFFGQNTNSPYAAALLMGYSAGRHLAGRRAWTAGGCLIAGVTVGIVTSQSWEGPADLLWVGILFLPPLIAGQAIHKRVALRRELLEKAERLEAEREVAARRAVEVERGRIASELQAVVANGVSAMVVQAEAVPRLLAAEDPARASEAFEVIEETGRDALAEMRRLLGVLRREGQPPELTPQPGLARVDAMVERLRQDGLEVKVQREGEERPLTQGIDLTAFRVLQDGLNAAVDAAAGRLELTIRYGARDLELEVRDDRDGGPETQLTGLRERLNLYGGRVRGGRGDAGGYLLEARLPARMPAGSAAPVGGAA